MQLTYHFQTIKELTHQTGLAYDQIRYRVNKMVKEGTAEKTEAAGSTYYRLANTPLTVNDTYSVAQTYTFHIRNKQDRDLAIHFAASYCTDRRNAQVAMSKFIKSYRHEGTFYGLKITK